MEKFLMLINGEWTNSESKETFPVINPATEEVICEVPKGGEGDAKKALEAAAKAFPQWSSLSLTKRGELLHRTAAIIKQRKDLIANILTQEQGKPFRQAQSEVSGAADVIEYFAEEGKRTVGEIIPTDSPNRRSLVIKQPVGVCVVITPWNYPVGLLSWKLGPALITGCTLVAKPASYTPLSPIRFIECFKEAGIPNGVINLLTGPGHTVGKELVGNPISRKIAFTGESATGKDIMKRSADSLKRISLELGNNAPLIVCEDADIENAVGGASRKSFDNMGQICNSINRIYLIRSTFDKFIGKFIKRTKALTIANGLKKPDADLGPMISDEQRKLVREHIKDAQDKGAKVLYGGTEPPGKEFSKGFYFLPTVLIDVNHNMRIMNEETFGPVAPIMVADNIKTAIEQANNTRYGLVAYVYTKNLKNIVLAAEHLEFGTVDINNVSGGHAAYPYGGWKESGLGLELSHYGLEEYLEVKHIRIDI